MDWTIVQFYIVGVGERTPVPIASVEALIVAVPAEGNAFAEGSEETVLVKVTDEKRAHRDRRVRATPSVTKAMIDMATINFWSQGIKDIVSSAPTRWRPRPSSTGSTTASSITAGAAS